MRRRRAWRTWIVTGLALALAAPISGCSRRLTAGQGERAPAGATGGAGDSGPQAYRVALADIDHRIFVNGELRAAVSRELTVPNIRSGFASTVTFLAPEGSQVKQGDRIVEFDASSLLSQRSEAQRKLDEARLKIEKTRAEQEAAPWRWSWPRPRRT